MVGRMSGARKVFLRKVEIFSDLIHRPFDGRSINTLADQELEKDVRPGRRTVLYVGIRYDYGFKDQGLSFEHYNFLHTISNMDLNFIYFDYDRLMRKFGSEKMSKILLEAVHFYRPDYIFYFHFKDWIPHEAWREVSQESGSRTIIWLSDDHWRYEESRTVWELFDLVVTTDTDGLEKRRREGRDNVVLSQWGCNQFLYRKADLPKAYDVSFIGSNYGNRGEFIEFLRSNGVEVVAFGSGWSGSGRVSQSELIRILNQSKICLNISFAGKGGKVQIKGRDFEVPGTGSMLLTKRVQGIDRYFKPGEEIVTYEDEADCLAKIRQYLADDAARERIADAGHRRALKDHTIERRLRDIFSEADAMSIERRGGP